MFLLIIIQNLTEYFLFETQMFIFNYFKYKEMNIMFFALNDKKHKIHKIVHTTVYFVCYKTQKNKALKSCFFLQMYNLHNSMYIFPLGDKFDKITKTQ